MSDRLSNQSRHNIGDKAGGLATINPEPPTRAPDTDDPEAQPAPPHDIPNPDAIPPNEGGEQE